MTEKEREAEFPRHVDLGRDVPDYGNTPVAPKAKKGKTKVSYPCLYISGIKDLSDIPAEGCMLVDYRVVGFNKREGQEPSIEIECRTICLPEKGESQDGYDAANREDDEAGDMIDQLAKKAGVKTDDED